MSATTPAPPPPPGAPKPPTGGQSFIQKTWVIVVALVFCFPVGLVFLWLHPAWSTKAKAIISGIVAVLVIPALFISGGDDGDVDGTKNGNDKKTQGADPTEHAVAPLAYSIEVLDDIDGNRYTARVVIPGEPTPAEIRATALAVMEEVRDSRPYSGLMVFMYEREEFVAGGQATIGTLEDAPNGEWPDAFNAPAGEYDDNEWTVDAMAKPWDEAPSEDVVELWHTYQVIYSELVEEGATDEAEPEATRRAAQEHGVSEEDVFDASGAVLEWTIAGETHTYDADTPVEAPEPDESDADSDAKADEDNPWPDLPVGDGPTLKASIDEDAANGNCASLQETFDTWSDADRFDSKPDLLDYIDKALRDNGCYDD